jgi:hypothetical protein
MPSRLEHSILISGTRIVVPAGSVQERLTDPPLLVPLRNTMLSMPRSQRFAGSWLAGMATYVCHHCAVRGALGGATLGVDAAVDAVGGRTQPTTIVLRASQRNALLRRPVWDTGEIPMAGLQSDGDERPVD